MTATVTIISTPKTTYVISEAPGGYAVYKDGKQVSRTYKRIGAAMDKAIDLTANDEGAGFRCEPSVWKKWHPTKPKTDLGSL